MWLAGTVMEWIIFFDDAIAFEGAIAYQLKVMRENPGIQQIRPFLKEDIPQVADMFQRLLLGDTAPMRLLSPAALPDYFEEIFFQNPWYDESIPSLVYQEKNGKIIGFLGVVPRQMSLLDQPVRVAVSFHFMVEPENRSSMAGVKLLRAFFAGPQDLSLTDGAGDVGRRIWEGVGGATAWAYSLLWTRILQPAHYAVDLLRKRKAFSPFAYAISPLRYLADAAAQRMLPQYFPNAPQQCSEEELDAETLLRHLPQFSKIAALRPVYNEDSLRWLLKHAGQMKLFGDFKTALVRDSSREVIGWFMYYLKPGGMSCVFQFAARKGAINEILDSLFSHARRHGAAAISGRLYPCYMQELSDKRCYFHRDGGWVLIHSNNDKLLDVVQQGNAFLTGLEGESCLLF